MYLLSCNADDFLACLQLQVKLETVVSKLYHSELWRKQVNSSFSSRIHVGLTVLQVLAKIHNLENKYHLLHDQVSSFDRWIAAS